MPDPTPAAIEKLMWEERERMGTVPMYFGSHCCLRTSRQGGWTVLTKGEYGLPAVEVKVLGKCTSTR